MAPAPAPATSPNWARVRSPFFQIERESEAKGAVVSACGSNVSQQPVPGAHPPAMFFRFSRTLWVSESPGGRTRSQRARVSRSSVIASVSRPTL